MDSALTRGTIRKIMLKLCNLIERCLKVLQLVLRVLALVDPKRQVWMEHIGDIHCRCVRTTQFCIVIVRVHAWVQFHSDVYLHLFPMTIDWFAILDCWGLWTNLVYAVAIMYSRRPWGTGVPSGQYTCWHLILHSVDVRLAHGYIRLLQLLLLILLVPLTQTNHYVMGWDSSMLFSFVAHLRLSIHDPCQKSVVVTLDKKIMRGYSEDKLVGMVAWIDLAPNLTHYMAECWHGTTTYRYMHIKACSVWLFLRTNSRRALGQVLSLSKWYSLPSWGLALLAKAKRKAARSMLQSWAVSLSFSWFGHKS